VTVAGIVAVNVLPSPVANLDNAAGVNGERAGHLHEERPLADLSARHFADHGEPAVDRLGFLAPPQERLSDVADRLAQLRVGKAGVFLLERQTRAAR